MKFIDRLNRFIGEKISWLNLFLVILICVDVFLRYTMSETSAWVSELEWHLFALIFILGGAYAFLDDDHVRVDVFYDRFKKRKKNWVNILGIVIFLLPWCGLAIWYGFSYAQNSFLIQESSPDPGGLPARYIIKFSIVIGFFLLALQAISELLKIFKGDRN